MTYDTRTLIEILKSSWELYRVRLDKTLYLILFCKVNVISKLHIHINLLCAKIRCFFESTKYLATNLIQTLVLSELGTEYSTEEIIKNIQTLFM